ncbi:RNA polymerase sigma-70 factor [Prolixibacteraceae bacterium Z1-6]|uniref:RNA polymerase sigma-70 factor n=1 Tax=Draconibacterium aestuarii TaxID=2998507 RepID=A0A9X3FDF3_9BACT|nr:RNA polymerase sigma-70 factor [Prolixibacteraceae bacterium Z1-6]
MKDLTSKLVQGNIKAFKKIHRFYYPRLNHYARNLVNNDQEAEDLVQDVFIQIWEQRHNLKQNQNLGAYLFTLVKNKSINILKHKIIEEKYILKQRTYLSEELYHISFELDQEFVSTGESLIREIKRIINHMPERCGETFALKWLEGKKNREIAEVMNISETMVDKHLAKGLKIAREKLSSKILFFLLATKIKH